MIVGICVALTLFASAVIMFVFAFKGEKKKNVKPSEKFERVHKLRVKSGYLNTNEYKFFKSLEGACGEQFLVYPKVKLADIVYHEENKKLSKTFNYSLDFVLFEPGSRKPLLAVDLHGDRAGEEELAKIDDKIELVLTTIGIPILAVKLASAYDERELYNNIVNTLNDFNANAINKK